MRVATHRLDHHQHWSRVLKYLNGIRTLFCVCAMNCSTDSLAWQYQVRMYPNLTLSTSEANVFTLTIIEKHLSHDI